MLVRLATSADQDAIHALMAPEIAAGRLLAPHPHAAMQFVAQLAPEGEVVGCVALTPWSARVIELGSLVSGVRRRGVGRALIEAAAGMACDDRYDFMVALTAETTFFGRVGFVPHVQSPWRWAKGEMLRIPDGEMGKGMLYKSTGCASCHRLSLCAQVLMVRPLTAGET